MTPTGMTKTESPDRARFVVVDSWRGILAVIVAIGHFAHWTGANDSVPIAFVLAVDVFFILSGFVIANSIFDAESRSAWILRFPIRRVFRIFPTYLVTGALTLFLLSFDPAMDWAAIPITTWVHITLLLQGAAPISIIPPSLLGTSFAIGWALTVEVWLGILVFSLVAVLRNRVTLLVPLLMITASLSLIFLVAYSPTVMDVHHARLGLLPFGFLRGIAGFSVGIICYLGYRKIGALKYATIVEILIVALIIWFYGSGQFERWNEFLVHPLGGLLILIFACEQGYVSKLLRWAPFRLLGACSFGIYICHPLIIMLFSSVEQSFSGARLVVYLPAVVGLAWGLHVLVERSGMRVGARLSRSTPNVGLAMRRKTDVAN